LVGEPIVGLSWDEVATRAFAHQDGVDIVLRDGRRLTQSQRDLPDRSGRIVLLTDDTEARAIRELLDRHRRLSAMGEMAAKLAHQIRTPLSAALLYASQLAAPAISAAERQRFAERAVARLKDLDRTVQEMLTFARGGPQPAEHVRVGSVLAEVLQVLEPELDAGGMVLQVVCDADAAELTGSRTALAGALANLVTNARQAMNGQGVVLLEAHPAGDGWVDIRVSDSGPGIPPQHRERLFEPFFTTRQGGTGLGLAIVKSVVDAHHGTIAAVDSPLGGACFSIRLPLSVRGTAGTRPGRVDA
jgi:two-component system sensor histidine kinase FlrB